MKCHQVLVIEDDLLSRQQLSRELSSRNFITYFAKSGEEAIRKLSHGLEVDIILVEVDLPGMNGWRFIQNQKSLEHSGHIPTLIYSREVGLKNQVGSKSPHHIQSESIDALMDSMERICGEDQGLNKNAPEIRRIILPRKRVKLSA